MVGLSHFGFPDYPDGQLRASARDLATFLAKQGLPPHVCARLQAEDVDTVATLALVTEQDLVEIGVALGPRRKLLIAIASLSGVA